MKPVTTKIETLRRAVAQAVVRAAPETLARMQANEVPKKDVLPFSRAAALLAAKKTPELLPDCHPLPLDAVDVTFDVQQDRIEIRVSVEAIWKTGVEMEALTAASVAALTIYDMLKPIDKNLEILSTKLLSKEGGKTDYQDKPHSDFRAAVLVTSDGTHQGKRTDKSGRLIEETLRSYGITASYTVLPDERALIVNKLRELCSAGTHLIFTTGGTGLGPRDVTVEATREIMDREVPGIMEAARAYGQRRTPYAMLSRGLAAQRGSSLIINLPGSSGGVRESLQAIFPALLHGFPMMKGHGHE